MLKFIVIVSVFIIFAALVLFETNPGRMAGRALFGSSFNMALHKWRQSARTYKVPGKGNQPPTVRKPKDLAALLAARGAVPGDPVFIRIFKAESRLEIWIKPKTSRGRYVLLTRYPVCAWSGRLGPKLKQGDKQAPEGFYQVSRGQLNPKSRYFRSFNLGYPNRFDRSHGRTGDFLMVHGNCVSAGCYAMTDPVMADIWTLVTQALKNGQGRFDVHVFPFRMNALNMMLYKNNRWFPFWQNLKEGYDAFEQTRIPPGFGVHDGRYVISQVSSRQN